MLESARSLPFIGTPPTSIGWIKRGGWSVLLSRGKRLAHETAVTNHHREHTDSNRPGGKKNEAMNMNAGGKSESRLFSAVKLTDATVFAINS